MGATALSALMECGQEADGGRTTAARRRVPLMRGGRVEEWSL